MPHGANGQRSKHSPRAADLSALRLSDAEAQEAQEAVEIQLGARCNGCGRRITIGTRFTSIDVRHSTPVMTMAACTREDCDFAERARDGATFIEMVEFAWLDDNGPDAPAAKAIVRRNERMREQAPASSLPDCGHGHVHPRPDGGKARCGGPAICAECARDQAAVAAHA